jgi:hypothetical protein
MYVPCLLVRLLLISLCAAPVGASTNLPRGAGWFWSARRGNHRREAIFSDAPSSL